MNYSVSINPLKESDLSATASVRNSVRSYLHDSNYYSYEDCVSWFNSLPKSSRRYAIVATTPQGIDMYAGTCRVDQIDNTNLCCYAGLDVSPIFHRRGIGYSAWILLLDKLFNGFGMEVVRLEVLMDNSRAINLYKKLDFRTEGILRDRVIREDRTIDCLVMSLSKKEFLTHKKENK